LRHKNLKEKIMPSIIFKNALIVDGTGREPFISDLKVSGTRIKEIGRLTPGEDDLVIDAQGLALCPGFIDAHGHSDYHLLVVPSGESKILQGMTTEIGGNCGYSAGPVYGEVKKEREKFLKDELGINLNFQELKDYFAELEEKKLGINFVELVGYNTVRANVLGYRRSAPDKKEMKKIHAQIKNALEQGASGMSAGLIYAPGTYTDADELADALAPVAEAKGIFACHIRSEGDRLLEAIEEFISIGRRAKVRLELSHLKTGGPRNWHKLDRAFELIENAQKDGIEIKADRYPYTASFTSLNAVLPDWVFEGGEKEYRRRLKQEKERIKEDMEKQYEASYWDRIRVAECFGERRAEFEGKTISEMAFSEKRSAIEFVVDFLENEEVSPNAIFYSMSEDNMVRIFQKPWVMLGSDSGARGFTGVLAKGKPHPRVFGAFPRFFREFVLERKLLSLEEAVKRCTFLPAEWFRVIERGKIQEGFYADLVLFDPEKISDSASFENPFQAPLGIEMVLVNGEIAVEKGKLSGRMAGRVLRKGR